MAHIRREVLTVTEILQTLLQQLAHYLLDKVITAAPERELTAKAAAAAVVAVQTAVTVRRYLAARAVQAMTLHYGADR